VAAREGRIPTPAELQAYSLGQLDPQRDSEVEAHLARHPECLEVIAGTPDDEMLEHLRGAGALPKPRARPWLLQLAVDAVAPVLGGCAGVLVGMGGGLAGAMAGQAAEKAINFFGQRIVDAWRGWLCKQPAGLQVAALTALADLAPEAARSEVEAGLAEQAPQVSAADRQVAIDYLSAIPRSVRRSLLSGRDRGGRQLPPTISLEDARSLLQLLPLDLPPYSAPAGLPGTDYQLEELIGTGGFGAVYRASSPSLQYLPLAIKFCLDRSLKEALEQERANLDRLMRAGGQTWSPRLVRLYGYNLEHRTPFLVYEFVPGGDLVHWLASQQAKTGRGLTPAEALTLITQVAEALAFAHERGLVHRDLKPANVLMTGDGTIKLADFGIGGLVARQAAQSSRVGTMASSRLSAAEQVSLFRGAGTPLYMSVEQKQGAAPDPRHDIYSLGVMWYQLLVGDVTREMAHGWARELEAKFSEPARHISLIEKCVGWIEERPKDAGELLTLLSQLQVSGGAEVKSTAPKPRPVSGKTAVEAVPPPPAVSLVGQSVKSPVPSATESERSRQIRFVTGLRQLLERHKKFDLCVWRLAGEPYPSIGFGLFFGVLGCLFLTVFSNIIFGVLCGFGSLASLTDLLFKSRRKLNAEQSLSTKIEEMLTVFTQECQTWGGRAALADRKKVKAILRELEKPQRR
jgi:serine/threonine protein kinase